MTLNLTNGSSRGNPVIMQFWWLWSNLIQSRVQISLLILILLSILLYSHSLPLTEPPETLSRLFCFLLALLSGLLLTPPCPASGFWWFPFTLRGFWISSEREFRRNIPPLCSRILPSTERIFHHAGLVLREIRGITRGHFLSGKHSFLLSEKLKKTELQWDLVRGGCQVLRIFWTAAPSLSNNETNVVDFHITVEFLNEDCAGGCGFRGG